MKRAQKRRARRALGVCSMAFSLTLLGAALALSADFWIAHTTRGHIHLAVPDLPRRPSGPYQAAIVPGARVHPSGQPSTALEDRLEAALALYREGRVERVLVSGDHAAPEYDEVNAMAAWLVERGVPVEDIFLDHAGLRTLDTMERAAQVFSVETAVVCTQAFHLPRSVFLARRAGIDAVGVVVDRHVYTHATRDRVREIAARTLALWESYVTGRAPRHLGPPIPITGDARRSHDRWTGR